MNTKVTGLSDLQAMLNTLPAKMEANIMRAALRQGANVIRDEAKANVPAKTGLLRKGIKVSTRSKRGVVVATIKPGGKHGYLARWIEYGVAAHHIAPKTMKALAIRGALVEGVNHPGFSPKPFLRPALQSKAQAALVAVGEAVKLRLTKQGLNTADIDIGPA